MQRGLSPRLGGGSQFDMINRVEKWGGAKTSATWKIMELRPVCPQLIAKANPTPAGKLAFVIRIAQLI